MRLPRGAPVPVTIEGVSETQSLADALKFFIFACRCVPGNLSRYFAAALSRLLQSLQNFGQLDPFSVLPEAFASFHSAAHFFWRSRAASCPALGSLFALGALGALVALAGFSDALGCCADAVI